LPGGVLPGLSDLGDSFVGGIGHRSEERHAPEHGGVVGGRCHRSSISIDG
jgi:hypothetical protein